MEAQKWFKVLRQTQNVLYSQPSQTPVELRGGGIVSWVVVKKLFALMGYPSRLAWLGLTRWFYPHV